MVLVPSLFFAITYPNAFVSALDASGGYGDTIINGLIPALMVWIGRYKYKMSGAQRFPGGRFSLSVIIAFALFVIVLETVVRFTSTLF